MKIDFIGRKFIKPISLNMHSHNIWEIIYATSGSGTLIVDQKEYPFTKGTVACIPPNTTHHNSKNTNSIHTTILTPDFIKPSQNKVVFFEDDSNGTLGKLIDVMLSRFYETEPNKTEILSRLSDALSMIIKEMIYTGDKITDVEKVKNTMISNFANPDFTVGDAMENTNYSEAHFRKLFQNEVGMPPVKYLTELRLSSAATQLKKRANSEMSIASIALEAGFSDQSYFARKFKEKYGVSPREYWSKHRK